MNENQETKKKTPQLLCITIFQYIKERERGKKIKTKECSHLLLIGFLCTFFNLIDSYMISQHFINKIRKLVSKI